jgi:DNA polymerase epsilon subunit 2
LLFRDLLSRQIAILRAATRLPCAGKGEGDPVPRLVETMSTKEKRAALKAFKQRGYVVQVGALERVLGGFDAVRDEFADVGGRPAFLERVLDALARSTAMGDDGASMLTVAAAADAVDRVCTDLHRASGARATALELVDVFNVPSPARSRRAAAGASGRGSGAQGNATLDARPEAKAELFRARYELLLAKTLRNPRFTPPASSVVATGNTGVGSATGAAKSPYLQLTAIDSLRGTRGDRLVLGMLTQLEEGSWFLEDLNGAVEVDLSEAHTTAGLHTDSSFVIAQGQLVESDGDRSSRADVDSRIFKVFAMGTPPLEDRDASIQALGKEANLFGGRYDQADEASMKAVEDAAADAMIVILSDVFLDDPRVLAGLRLVFEGYLEDGVVPTAVVLMGSFTSHPFGQRPSDVSTLAAAFTSLGEMIASDFPQLAASTTFVVVPGPHDAGPGNILPRPALPAMLTDGFVAALPPDRVMLGTNPCRLRYLTQEIVLLREDLLHKMLRNCAVRPDHSDTGVMAEHMVKSIVDQAHLCPLPLASRPVLWAHDHALWLFPSPHLVVVADKVDGYTFRYGATTGMNPGSFGADLSFAVYLPAEKKSQQCTLDPDELMSSGGVGEEDELGAAEVEEGEEQDPRDGAALGTGQRNGGIAVGGGEESDDDHVGAIGHVHDGIDAFPRPGQLDGPVGKSGE